MCYHYTCSIYNFFNQKARSWAEYFSFLYCDDCVKFSERSVENSKITRAKRVLMPNLNMRAAWEEQFLNLHSRTKMLYTHFSFRLQICFLADIPSSGISSSGHLVQQTFRITSTPCSIHGSDQYTFDIILVIVKHAFDPHVTERHSAAFILQASFILNIHTT